MVIDGISFDAAVVAELVVEVVLVLEDADVVNEDPVDEVEKEFVDDELVVDEVDP